jgi:hypothetical protein
VKEIKFRFAFIVVNLIGTIVYPLAVGDLRALVFTVPWIFVLWLEHEDRKP